MFKNDSEILSFTYVVFPKTKMKDVVRDNHNQLSVDTCDKSINQSTIKWYQ